MGSGVPPDAVVNLWDEDRCWELLGVMLDAPAVVPAVLRVIEPGDFGEGDARKVFDSITRLFEHGREADPLLVRDDLGDPKLTLRAMDAMRDSAIVPGNAVFHAQRLRALGVLRQVRAMGADLTNVEPTDDPAEILSKANDVLRELGAEVASSWLTPAELALEAEAEIEESTRREILVPTGFPSLDMWLGGGLHPGRFYVLGARTSVGKSAWATTVVRRTLDRGQRVLFVSLEMTGPEVLTRLVAEKYDVNHEDVNGLVNAWITDEVQEWPLHFMGIGNIGQICATARRLRPEGLRLIVLDYLQLIPPSEKHERRDLEIGYITRALKLLSVELRVPVLALSQVNRSGDEDKPPTLRNLRESGNIEQDANVAILLHRLHDHADKRYQAKLAVAKNRHGYEGSMTLNYVPNRTRFTESGYIAS